MPDLVKSMHISAAGMKAQSARLRVVSENIANVSSTGSRPGEQPYRRKVITFENEFNRQMQENLVNIKDIDEDKTPFPQQYDPSHPAADENGYVLMPNVNSFVEMMDMREARRSYEANLNMIETSKGMLQQTIGMINSRQ